MDPMKQRGRCRRPVMELTAIETPLTDLKNLMAGYDAAGLAN